MVNAYMVMMMMDKNERISEPELNTKNVSKHEKMTDVDSENDNENVAAVVDNNNGYGMYTTRSKINSFLKRSLLFI